MYRFKHAATGIQTDKSDYFMLNSSEAIHFLTALVHLLSCYFHV